MSNVSSIVSNFLSGKPMVEEAASNTEDTVWSANESVSEAQEDYGMEAKSSESTEEDLLPGSEDTPPDSEKVTDAKVQSKSQTPDKEVITITDENGRRKVEIDYADREAIKKAFQFQHGARKWQAERDKALESRKVVETELSQIKNDWAALDQAFQQGPDKLFDLLSGRPGAFDEHLAKRAEKQEFLRHASPAEIRAMEAQEAAERQAAELEKIRKENAEFKKQVTQEKEQAEEKALESKLHPTFDKYRFADKLGDAQDELLFDKMLWTSAMERLEEAEGKGLDITPALIDQEFRTVAAAIRKRINVQAEKKAGKVVEQKKREATENVQAKVMSGYKTGGNAQEARDLLKKGDLTSLLKGWGKYGSLFNK